MGKRSRLVCGVGVNDAEECMSRRKIKNGKTEYSWRLYLYETWKNMLDRCYGENFKEKYPTYSNCTIDESWLKFSNFKQWAENREWRGMQLDKDILLPGNKHYSPDRCVFISGALNSFLIRCEDKPGKFRVGVSWHKKAGKFVARCRNPFTNKREHLGLFCDEISAHLAWKSRKHELACIYADMQDDERVANALRARFAQ